MFLLGMITMYFIVGIIIALDILIVKDNLFFRNDNWFTYLFLWWTGIITFLFRPIINSIIEKREKEKRKNYPL